MTAARSVAPGAASVAAAARADAEETGGSAVDARGAPGLVNWAT